MAVTEPTEVIVESVKDTYLWLEILHGPDMGMRVRVPLYDEDYPPFLTEQLIGLKKGDVIEVKLERKQFEGWWKVRRITNPVPYPEE